MNKYGIITIVFYGFAMLFFTGCKPRPATENILPAGNVVQPEKPIIAASTEKPFDTTEFIRRVHRYPEECIGRYALASRDSLRNNDLNYFSPKELRIIRNSIYARYGYRFKDTALQASYDKYECYRPLFDNVEQYLAPVERANIKFIMEKEKTNPDISDEEQFQLFLEIYHHPHGVVVIFAKLFMF